MRTAKTLYNEEVQSINLSYVEFANKTANIKCKKLWVKKVGVLWSINEKVIEPNVYRLSCTFFGRLHFGP